MVNTTVMMPRSLSASLHQLGENISILEVCIVPISVLIISVGKLSILLAVWDSSKRRVVFEARVKDLVHYFLRLHSANVPHSQDGTKSTASYTYLSKGDPD